MKEHLRNLGRKWKFLFHLVFFKEFLEDLDKLLVSRKLNNFRTIWKLSKEISETFVSVRIALESVVVE